MSCSVESKPRNLGFEYIELVGQKVRLRSTTADDARNGFRFIHNNHDILKWLCWNGPKNRNELAETYGIRWPQEMREGTKYSFAIEEKDNPGAIIGCIDARILRYPQQFEAGYWLGMPYWRKGYTSESLALICHLCFKPLGAAVVTAGAFVGNLASRRVQEKNGFQFEGTLRRQIFKDGKWIDLWHLSLLREEWEKRGFKPVSERLVPCSDSQYQG
jgi:ribosomal-protein-alanine N-acetyltransferase